MSAAAGIRKKSGGGRRPPPNPAGETGPRARLRVQRLEMAEDARRGPYRGLLEHLESVKRGGIRRAPFGEIEKILGFALPPEARAGALWWENDKAQPQARAWMGAGWEVSELDTEAETVEFTRGLSLPKSPKAPSSFMRAPLIHVDSWGDSAGMRREEIYGDRMYPTCSRSSRRN